MFVHHLATVSLISFSYVNNMARVGSLVMCVHDASDFLLEVQCERNCILSKYCKCKSQLKLWSVFSVLCLLNFSFPGCQVGQLCQIPASVRLPVCGIWCSLYWDKAHHLPLLVSVCRIERQRECVCVRARKSVCTRDWVCMRARDFAREREWVTEYTN